MQDQATLSERGLFRKLENFIRVTLSKLRNIWRRESVPTGIQLYVEMDD